MQNSARRHGGNNMPKNNLNVQFHRSALAALVFTFIGCASGVSQQVRTSAVPSPYAGSTTFCVAPFEDSEHHPVVAGEFEAVLFEPNRAGIIFKPEKNCDGPFLVSARAVIVQAGHDFGEEAAYMNKHHPVANGHWVPVIKDTLTRVEVVIIDKTSNQTIDDVFFTSSSKSSAAAGSSMGVLDDARAIGVNFIEYLAERRGHVNEAK
jgi:hypothetical protein